MNTSMLRRVGWQSLTLACPGVVIGAVLTAVFAHYVFPYGWSWNVSMLFGSILSATDPVAVVTIFNALGVSPRLTLVVSGESIFNDGTAMVLFTLFFKLCIGESIAAGQTFGFFAWMTSVGPLCGVAMGRVLVYAIGQTSSETHHSDSITQLVFTVCCAYLVYFVVEEYVESSGLLATVSAGIAVAGPIWPRFISQDAIRSALHTIEFVGNTLVFVLAGMLFGQHCTENLDRITLVDFMYLGAFYVACTIIRAIMVCALWPLLSRVGPRLSLGDVIVVVWAGLRGALGLALAVVVELSPDIDRSQSLLILFHVGGIAAMTILINGTLAPVVLQRLGYMKQGSAQVRLFRAVTHRFHQQTKDHMERQLRDKGLDELFFGVKEDDVKALVTGAVPQSFVRTSSFAASWEEQGPAGRLASQRELVLRTVKSIYSEMAGQGLLPRRSYSTRSLIEAADSALCESKSRLGDFEVLKRRMAIGKYLTDEEYYRGVGPWRLRCLNLICSPRAEFLLHVQRIIYALIAFAHAHRRAVVELAEYVELHDIVVSESNEQVESAHSELRRLPQAFVHNVRTKMLAGSLLQYQRQHLSLMEEKGILTSNEAERLEQDVSRAVEELETKTLPADGDAIELPGCAGSGAGNGM
mmetsp:Transcript_28199/g.79691  ORF Transcript_28199/g.79691 Transcript_28199/m.79691 type:complete len:639 (-) Transcript_28199:76-1992(-)